MSSTAVVLSQCCRAVEVTLEELDAMRAPDRLKRTLKIYGGSTWKDNLQGNHQCPYQSANRKEPFYCNYNPYHSMYNSTK